MALIWSAFENHNLSKDEENRILKWCLVRCGGTAETVEAGVKFFLREKDSGKVEASSGSNAKLTRSNSGFVADHGYRMSSGMQGCLIDPVGDQRQAGSQTLARSWLYRRRFLQVNFCLKALDEIYKIYTYASLGEKNRN